MRRIAVVTDSNSGITQSQAKELDVYVIPMPLTIDGEPFFEDVNLTQDSFFQKLGEDCEISTSQPAIGTILELWDNLLKDYEEIVHIPMSSGLSASYETSAMLARDYNGRVQVVNNQRISVTLRRSVTDAITLAEKGYKAVQIKECLETTKFESSIYIMMDTLKYIKKGGRITPAGAAIGSILQIKPILQIQGSKLDSYAKARGAKQARKIMIDAIRNDFNTRFAEYSAPEHMWLDIAYTYNREPALDFKSEVESILPGYDIHIEPLSLSVSCHIGPGALALACSKKIV